MARIQSLLRRSLVGLVFLGVLAGVAPAEAAPPARIRILLTGDSIVQGFHGDYTWRYRLAKEFARQGRAVDFVGSRSAPSARSPYKTAQYADPNFDSNHFALVASGLTQQAGWIGAEVAAQRPDVIVIAAGINDLRNGLNPAQTDVRLRWWLAAARQAKPDVSIVVSPVLASVYEGRPNLGQEINSYNALARKTVTELSTAQSRIYLADTTRGWTVATDTYDDLHPNPTGETLIAQRMAEIFRRMGILTQPSSIYRTTSWNRQPRVSVVIRNQRAVLTWDSQSLTGTRVWMRRVGSAARYSGIRYSGGTMMTYRLVPRATYEFRISMTRTRMSTPLGPIARITVPSPARPARPAPVARVVVDAAGVHWTRSALAAKYSVKFRRGHQKRWIVRSTSGLYLKAGNASRAKVFAINGAGRSAARAGAR